MFIDMSQAELEFILACIDFSKDMGAAYISDFDTSKYDSVSKKLKNVKEIPMPFIVEFTYDNGAVLEDMRAVCMAFDEDDARAIIQNKFGKSSDEYAKIKSVKKFTDESVISERV